MNNDHIVTKKLLTYQRRYVNAIQDRPSERQLEQLFLGVCAQTEKTLQSFWPDSEIAKLPNVEDLQKLIESSTV